MKTSRSKKSRCRRSKKELKNEDQSIKEVRLPASIEAMPSVSGRREALDRTESSSKKARPRKDEIAELEISNEETEQTILFIREQLENGNSGLPELHLQSKLCANGNCPKKSGEDVLYASERAINCELANKILVVNQIEIELLKWKSIPETVKVYLEGNQKVLKQEREPSWHCKRARWKTRDRTESSSKKARPRKDEIAELEISNEETEQTILFIREQLENGNSGLPELHLQSKLCANGNCPKKSGEDVLYASERAINCELANKILVVNQIEIELLKWKSIPETVKVYLEGNQKVLKQEREPSWHCKRARWKTRMSTRNAALVMATVNNSHGTLAAGLGVLGREGYAADFELERRREELEALLLVEERA
ncbi:hypothetical protein RHGRI_032404 [Rhododendron griersonianum]|uniref:Uncharacterized protein n=1 Tax=Rhododendron griersonianum TaxID=479676 RepID=A0AAV6IEU9_9ERIC|nr:hypothetical protein RHGRI_032404 [Rhododendron griersonianum]